MMTRSASGSGSQGGQELIKVSAARRRNMERGNADLRRWIGDLLEVGLWHLPEREESVRKIAERLVDAQMGSIAKRLRMALDAIDGDADWAEEWLSLLGVLTHFTNLFEKLDELPPLLKADVWQFAGVYMKKKDVLALPPVQDHWIVLGEHIQSEERLLARRTWLFGLRSRRWGMLLDYGMNKKDLPKVPPVGCKWKSSLCFYPSATGFRALMANSESFDFWKGGELGFQDWNAFFKYEHSLTMKNPLMEIFPCLIRDVEPVQGETSIELIDQEGTSIPISEINILNAEWKALVAGGPLTIFGEVHQQRFKPWSVYTQNRVIPVN